MLDLSKPDTDVTPEQQKRSNRGAMRLLAALLWGGIIASEWSEWTLLLQLRALLTGLPWPVIVGWWALLVPLAWYGLVAIHEGGHALVGRLVGFRLLSFTAGPLHLTRQAQGWKREFKKRYDKLGGSVQLYPTYPQHMRGRYALLIAGGPLANLLTGGLALYVHFRWLAPHDLTLSAAWYLLDVACCVFGWLSVTVGGLNLVPYTSPAGHIIDGKRLWGLAAGGPAMHQQVGLLQFQYLSCTGVRPRNWDPAAVSAFAAHCSHSVLDFYAQYCVYGYYHDCRDLDGMQRHLSQALHMRKFSPLALQRQVLAEAAYVAALHTHNPEHARFWLDEAQQDKPFTAEEALFSRAAVAYAEGSLEEAATLLQASRHQLHQAPAIGDHAPLQECYDDLQHRIAQAAPTSPARTGGVAGALVPQLLRCVA